MKNTLTCIAAITLLLACDSKSPSTSNNYADQTGTVSCKSFGAFGSDQYAESLQKLIQLSGWTKGKTSIEEFALGLCEGDTKDPDSLVKFGHITPMQATKIASLLGVSYTPPSLAPTTVVNAEPQQDALTYISSYLWASKASGGCTMPNNLLVTYSPREGKRIVQNGKVIVTGGSFIGSKQKAMYEFQNESDQGFVYKEIIFAEGNPTVLSLGAVPSTVVSNLTDTVILISKEQIQVSKDLAVLDTNVLFDKKGIQYKKERKVETLDRCY